MTATALKSWVDSLRPRALDDREWMVMRWLFALVTAYHLFDRQPFSFTTNPHPAGLTHLVSLTFLGRSGMYAMQWMIAGPMLLLYALGRWQVATTTVIAVLSTLVRSHVNAQGFNQHATQIVTMLWWAQSLVQWAHWMRVRKGGAAHGVWTVGLPGVLFYYSQAAIGASYVLAGLAKLINSKGLWAWNAPYLSMDIVKSSRQAYYSTLDQSYAGVVHSAQWLVEHPWLARAGFTWALAIELGAILALRSRTWASVLGVSLIALHLGIQWMMHLTFIYNESLLLIFFVNPVGWVMSWRRKQSKIQGPLASAA